MKYTKVQLEKLLTILWEYAEMQKECISLLENNNKLLKELNKVLGEDNEKLRK
jgi:hypothetical protein